MKIFAYHNAYNGVGAYRVWQPMKYLKALGEDVRLLPKRLHNVSVPMDGKGGPPGAASHYEITKWADLLFSNFRTSYQDTARLVIQGKVKPLVLDIDDDFVNLPRWFPTYQEWQGGPDQIKEITSMPADEIAAMKADGWGEVVYEGRRCLMLPNFAKADLVKDQVKAASLLTVSTKRLAEVYAGWCKRVEVVPNAVDFDLWPENKRHDDGIIRIGLFGSNTHARDWLEVYDALERILREHENVRIVVNAWLVLDEVKPEAKLYETKRHFRLPQGLVERGLHEHPRVEMVEPCEIEDYPRWLAGHGVDIGLAPLENATFNRAKSNIKYLEFATLGIPGIYQELDPYEDVEHGVTGLKAKKPEDYYKGLKRLIENPELRLQIAKAARMDVEKRYNQREVSRKLQGLLASVHKEWNDEKAAAAPAA